MRYVSAKGRSVARGKAKPATISNLGFLCLLDLERTLFLQQIIARTMSMAADKDKLNVIDLGAGTGILGLTALELGAGSVTLVENDKECLEFLAALLREMGFRQVSKSKITSAFSRGDGGKAGLQNIIIYSGDAKTFRIMSPKSAKYDLVLCEMHETHLVSEEEVAALKNIRRYVKADAVFIPCADDLMLSVCDAKGNDLSDAVKIGSVDFGKIGKDGINHKGRLSIRKSGQAKYLKLWDRLYYPDNTVSEQDFQMFAQTKFMLLRGWEPVLKKGQNLILRVRFGFGDSSYNGYSLELQ
jgi:16S rRNA G966 N2-methylase RsmD